MTLGFRLRGLPAGGLGRPRNEMRRGTCFHRDSTQLRKTAAQVSMYLYTRSGHAKKPRGKNGGRGSSLCRGVEIMS